MTDLIVNDQFHDFKYWINGGNVFFIGAAEDDVHEQLPPEVMLQWFSNPELLNTILTSTSDFLEVIDHVKDKDKGREQIFLPL